MANKMLEEDFKTSHPDLTMLNVEEEQSPPTTREDAAASKSQTSKATSLPSPSSSPPQESRPKVMKSLTTRKSVEFAIDPPSAKRPRTVPVPLTAKQVVNAISTSITRHERMEAIQKAKDSFNHDVQAIHDDEMASGADAALVKHLTFLAFHTQQQSHDQDVLELLLTEISLTCDALESLLRASSAAVGVSFERMGRELLQLLVAVIDNELGRRNTLLSRQNSMCGEDLENDFRVKEEFKKEDDGGRTPDLEFDEANRGNAEVHRCDSMPLGTPEGDLLLRKATKILGHFARVGHATKPMAHFPGLLGVLLSIITMQPHSSVPWEARLSALWTIANLACNTDNMQMMACTPCLIDSLIEAASRPLHPGDPLEKTMDILRSRAIASRAVLNLSWSPENKIILSEHTALLDLLMELTVHRNAPLNHSRTVQGILLTTRLHAIGALRNLAAAPRRTKMLLCTYKNGRVLDTLTDAALNDTDAAIKDRAFAAIHNLAIHDTAVQIVNHPALVLALKDVLLSCGGGLDDEEGNINLLNHGSEDMADLSHSATDGHKTSPRIHASATLMVLERSITPDMESYEILRDLLDAVNPNPTTIEEEEPASNDVDDEMQVINAAAV